MIAPDKVSLNNPWTNLLSSWVYPIYYSWSSWYYSVLCNCL